MTETDVLSTDATTDSSGAAAPERRRRGGVSGMVLAELRDYARLSAGWVEERAGASPLRDCGPTMQRGQTGLSEPFPGDDRSPEPAGRPEAAAR